MPTSVRLDPGTEQRLRRLARLTGRTKSALIRDAIERLDREFEGEAGCSTYDRLRRYIGVADLGPEVSGRRAEELLRERFGRKGEK